MPPYPETLTTTGTLAGTARVGVLLFLVLLGSCTLLPLPPSPSTPEPSPLAEAEELFLTGQYQQARHTFQRVLDDPETPDRPGMRNRAQFYLACADIVLARTDRELVAAISSLGRWHDAQTAHDQDRPDYRLLVLALSGQGMALDRRSHEQQQQASRQDRKIASQKEKITELSSAVEALRKQLQELEAIDETVQKKRKSL